MNGPIAGLRRPGGTAPGVGGGELAVGGDLEGGEGGGALLSAGATPPRWFDPEGAQTDMSQAGSNRMFLKMG